MELRSGRCQLHSVQTYSHYFCWHRCPDAQCRMDKSNLTKAYVSGKSLIKWRPTMHCAMDGGRTALHNQKGRGLIWPTTAFVLLVRLSVKQLFHFHFVVCFISASLAEWEVPAAPQSLALFSFPVWCFWKCFFSGQRLIQWERERESIWAIEGVIAVLGIVKGSSEATLLNIKCQFVMCVCFLNVPRGIMVLLLAVG